MAGRPRSAPRDFRPIGKNCVLGRLAVRTLHFLHEPELATRAAISSDRRDPLRHEGRSPPGRAPEHDSGLVRRRTASLLPDQPARRPALPPRRPAAIPGRRRERPPRQRRAAHRVPPWSRPPSHRRSASLARLAADVEPGRTLVDRRPTDAPLGPRHGIDLDLLVALARIAALGTTASRGARRGGERRSSAMARTARSRSSSSAATGSTRSRAPAGRRPASWSCRATSA